MNSQQEKILFEQYQWEYDYMSRVWTAPGGTMLSQDDVMGITADADGDLALMRYIVEHGQRKV